MESQPSTVPNPPLQHIAFILDGNGRWAKQRNLIRTEGHKAGAKRVQEIVEYAFQQHNIPYITLYAFSTENWSRSKMEVHAIFQIMKHFLKERRPALIKNKIRLKTIGDITRLPKSLQKLLNEVIEETAGFTHHTLCIALNYGAREEIMHAIRSLPKGRNVTEWKDIEPYLYTAGIPDPDLIVRTSGEQRLSNFLLLQAAYSEFYFTPTYWPDFDEKALDKALDDYAHRTRRFGGS
ncbi:MAG TPA: di-trans,poly-cis-decaprenylcistransferase [Opitutae bacterium]|nr:di-trans,poly-cis-decaprenylcistransferase [Opitutae bacterium]